MSLLQLGQGLGRGVGLLKKLKDNPAELFLDRIVALVVQLFIPIPLAGELVVYFKGPILAMLGTFVLIFIFIVVSLITIFASPAGFLPNLVQTISQSIVSKVESLPIESLLEYLEEGFVATDVPGKNPFGGSGFSRTTITAYFHDPNYFAEFGMIHSGVDLVPVDAYYSTDQAYLKTGQVVVFATNNGKATIYEDELGALTVDDINQENNLKTVYKHLKQILVSDGQDLKAGQPIGVMGQTGFATGEHLHYEVRLNQGGSWVAVDPLGYIH